MTNNIFILLNLDPSCSFAQLKEAFENKKNEIYNMNIKDSDKDILLNYYYNLFNQIKYNYMFNDNHMFTLSNINNTLLNTNNTLLNTNNPINNNYRQSSYTYSNYTNPDGSQMVYQRNMTNNNGVVNENTQKYIIDSLGNKILL
jgi:hypothetical protein